VNPNIDVAEAQDNLRRAAEILVGVSALPIERGARVRWPHNGIVWTRVSGYAWAAEDETGNRSAVDAPSAHVASLPFEVLP
jgi:hypothetical protein